MKSPVKNKLNNVVKTVGAKTRRVTNSQGYRIKAAMQIASKKNR